MTENDEKEVVMKVGQMMESLDRVEEYKSLTNLLQDFFIIFVTSIVISFAIDLYVDFFAINPGYNVHVYPFSTITNGLYGGASPAYLGTFAYLSWLLIPLIGAVLGIYWVDRRMKKARKGEWKKELDQGFPSALKLLQETDWDQVFKNIGTARLNYGVFVLVKLLGYWVASFILIYILYGFISILIHSSGTIYAPLLISFVLVLILSRKDLQKRFQQVTSLDTLLWELRWFYERFRSSEFEV